MREKCIVYISSTNYKIVSAGTEKFISEIIDAYNILLEFNGENFI